MTEPLKTDTAAAAADSAADTTTADTTTADATTADATTADATTADATTADTAAADTAAAAPADEPAPASPPRRGRKAAALAGGAVALAVLAGGAIAGSAALEGADRSVATRYWVPEGAPPAAPEDPAPVPAGELSGKLLPVPSGYSLGPDLGRDGNDYSFSGEKAVQTYGDARGGLSSSERKRRDEVLEGMKVKGLAGRSYTKDGGGAVYQVRIMQADAKAVGRLSEAAKKLNELAGDGRGAPAVDGHPEAKCVLLAIGEEKQEKIDSMDCVAVQGDVLVTFRAFGPKPFSPADAASFFKNQLSRLKSPGESV
ncbi:hypothetical protein SUDANB120_02867 [Streptomyces sp. enrichment culture]|uniref:hypothetical protein n=1 Tax=Streptomyces sp. enrichment culture TaxID=1795815 RepID=UPI003F5613E3